MLARLVRHASVLLESDAVTRPTGAMQAGDDLPQRMAEAWRRELSRRWPRRAIHLVLDELDDELPNTLPELAARQWGLQERDLGPADAFLCQSGGEQQAAHDAVLDSRVPLCAENLPRRHHVCSDLRLRTEGEKT